MFGFVILASLLFTISSSSTHATSGNEYVASASSDGTVIVWNPLENWSMTNRFRTDGATLSSLCFVGNRTLATLENRQQVELWELMGQTAQNVRSIRVDTLLGATYMELYSADTLVTGCMEGRLQFWSLLNVSGLI